MNLPMMAAGAGAFTMREVFEAATVALLSALSRYPESWSAARTDCGGSAAGPGAADARPAGEDRPHRGRRPFPPRAGGAVGDALCPPPR